MNSNSASSFLLAFKTPATGSPKVQLCCLIDMILLMVSYTVWSFVFVKVIIIMTCHNAMHHLGGWNVPFIMWHTLEKAELGSHSFSSH